MTIKILSKRSFFKLESCHLPNESAKECFVIAYPRFREHLISGKLSYTDKNKIPGMFENFLKFLIYAVIITDRAANKLKTQNFILKTSLDLRYLNWWRCIVCKLKIESIVVSIFLVYNVEFIN